MSADAVFASRAAGRVGSVLRNKWRIDGLLGVGGMAAVYAATHRNGKRVAIKMLHADLSHVDEARARFLREGYAANRVGHAGAVSVLDDDIADDGSVFLVMELLEGKTLAALAAERPGERLAPGEIAGVFEPLLAVLQAAHEKGIVHRDIKPENLFVTTEGTLKVLDFGVARVRELWAGPRATRTGQAMGTPAFMAPEQALGNWESVDARTDLWAAGASMFVLLSGRLVHEAPTVNQLLLAAMTKPAPKIRTRAADVPQDLADVIDRALEFDAARRWPDAASMRRALRAVAVARAELRPAPSELPRIAPPAGAQSLLSSAMDQEVGPPAATHRHSRRPLAIAAGLAAVAGLAASAVIARDGFGSHAAEEIPSSAAASAPAVESAPPPPAPPVVDPPASVEPAAPASAPAASSSAAASGVRSPRGRPSIEPAASPPPATGEPDPFSRWK